MYIISAARYSNAFIFFNTLKMSENKFAQSLRRDKVYKLFFSRGSGIYNLNSVF
jgi:hypothetical protein